MALAHARTIKVLSNTYQWKISPRGGLHLAIFNPLTKQKWVFWLENKTIVTPRVVKEYIEKTQHEYRSKAAEITKSSSSIDRKSNRTKSLFRAKHSNK